MAFIHPDRARNLVSARAMDGRGSLVNGRAEHALPVQERNRKRLRGGSRDGLQSMTEGEVTTSDGYAKNVGDYRLGSLRSEQAQGPERDFDDTRAPRPNALDADRSKRPRVEVSKPPTRNNPRQHINKALSQRGVQKLEKALRLASDYPDVQDIEAWRKLGQDARRSPRADHAFVYRQLRFDQRPHGLAFKEWRKRVHQEMAQLGLEDAYTGPLKNKMSGGEVEDEATEEMAQGTVETAADEQRRREIERMVADDELDIDIYGDEETRRKYEPWIMSRMDRT